MEIPLHARGRELIDSLGLVAHPEGGHFRRVYTSATHAGGRQGDGRAVLSAIHYLLSAGEVSRWHRIDADEVWHHAEGDALELIVAHPVAQTIVRHRLGRADSAAATTPLLAVPAGCWQAARPLGRYALVACCVAPEFRYAGFVLLDAAPDVAAWIARSDPGLMSLR